MVVWLKSLFTLALVLLVIYGAALTALYVFQRNVLYFPGQTYVSPQTAHADPALKEFPVKTADGIDLTGWYAPAKGKPYTIVFFHGNADNLRSVAEIARPYIALGYGMLLAEYRGYSGLPGSPTESGLYEDARAYMKALIASGVPGKNIVLFAHALGSGVAVQMANEYDVGGIMLMSPYMSMSEVAQLHYPIFPAALLTKARYEEISARSAALNARCLSAMANATTSYLSRKGAGFSISRTNRKNFILRLWQGTIIFGAAGFLTSA